MSAVLPRWCVLLSLLSWSAAPTAAQLIDDPLSTPEPAEEEPPAFTPKPPRTPEKRSAPPTRREEKRATAEDRAPPPAPRALEPPRSIAKASPEPAPEPAPSGIRGRDPLLLLFVSLLVVGVLLLVIERLRSWIKTNIALSRFLGGLVLALRLGGLGLLLAIVLKLLPGGHDWILGGFVLLILVIGWSIRDLFADLVAGGVLAAERRIKKGVWVSGDGFQGTVEGRSLRAIWLRDGKGGRLTVPNRAMVGAPLVFDAGADAEHEVEVRLEGYQDAGKVRLALTDAILSSPWVLAGATPVVLRDPADPVVWRVRTKLLEPRFSVHFEGELLERVEDLLRYEPELDERETLPGELPSET